MNETHKEDDEPTVKPPVIDLDAEDVTEDVAPKSESVETEAPREEPPPPRMAPSPPPPPRSKPPRRSSFAWILVALVAGVVAGAWLYRDVLASYFPTDEMTAMKARLADLEAKTGTLAEQVTAVGGAADAAKQEAAELGQAITGAEAKATAAQDGLAELGKRIATTEEALAAAKTDLDGLRTALSTSGPSTGTSDTAALAALAQRIDAIEKDLASLKASPTGGEDQGAATALSQALSDIKAKIAAGADYAEELDRIARMVPAASGLDVLTAHAAEGLPNAEGLAAELRASIPLLPKPPRPTASGDSYWDSVWEALTSIVRIRNIGETDWAALAEKAAAFAESGDLPQAISLIDSTEGTKPIPLSQWRDRAGQRLNLEAALEQASDAVLRQINALGGSK